jgi:hypothetical protein
VAGDRSSRFILFTKYYLGDKIKEDELGGDMTCVGEEKCIQDFGGET